MASQAPPQDQQAPVGLLFDSSLDGGIDQVLALAMLFHLQAVRRIRLGSISTGRFNLQNVAFLDAVARFYSRGQTGDYGPTRGLLPVGMPTAGTLGGVVPPMISAALARIGADGKPAYLHTVKDVHDTADAVALIRNALTAFPDANAAVVLAGGPANLLALLALPDGPKRASTKARVLSLAAGRFDGGRPDPAVRADVAGFRKLLATWPTPIVMAGTELNDALSFPGSSLDAIATWAPEHPVVDAYRAYRPMPYDAPTQAMAAVLHAVGPEEDHFALSAPGTIAILDDGRTQFTPTPDGRHRYLIVRPDQKQTVLRTLVQLVTEQPPAPPPRRTGMQPRQPDRSRPTRLAAFGLALAAVTVAGCTMLASRQATEPRDELASVAVDDEFDTVVRPILSQTCAMCHSGPQPAAGMNVTEFTSAESLRQHRDTWEKILRRLRAGEMPPVGVPKPEPERLAAMISYIERAFVRADAEDRPDPGRMVAHRLNRTEYTNTVRDLLGVPFRADKDFPADDSGHGFDIIGELLNLSPLLMERYMSAAERIAHWAISTEMPDRPLEIDYRSRDGRIRRLGRSVIEADHQVEFAGEHVVRFELPGERPPANGVDAAPVTLGFWMDGTLLATRTVETKPSGLVYFTPYSEEEMRLFLPAGDHVFRAAFVDDAYVRGLPEQDVFRNEKNKYLAGIVFAGPFPSSREKDTRKKIVTCDPNSGRACVERILSDLARRAYRRPATKRDVASLVRFVDLTKSTGGSVEEGIQLAIQAMLVSPNFLFRIERDPHPRDPTDVHEVSQFELASRLSYFLWSSMPDEELFALAGAGRLRDPRVLEAQVDRMIADPRSIAFAENFAGQWLETRNLDVVRPDPDLFAVWDLDLRESMKQETALFFQHVLRENRPIGDFLNADYTFLNERLADHYGIDGVTGPEFRRVALTTDRRGGILGQGAVLTVSSYPTRTSPVIRGKYVLENVLGIPPPPPPPDVPALEASGDGQIRSMREQLGMHRTNPVCASCHNNMDPLGYGLENYDAIGRWRDREGEFPIDPSGTLPNGKPFATGAEMRLLLAMQLPQFTRTVTEKMLTYALRRGLEPYDQRTVRRIEGAVAADDYRFRTMVHEIAKSLPFQARRGEAVTLRGGSR